MGSFKSEEVDPVLIEDDNGKIELIPKKVSSNASWWRKKIVYEISKYFLVPLLFLSGLAFTANFSIDKLVDKLQVEFGGKWEKFIDNSNNYLSEKESNFSLVPISGLKIDGEVLDSLFIIKLKGYDQYSIFNYELEEYNLPIEYYQPFQKETPKNHQLILGKKLLLYELSGIINSLRKRGGKFLIKGYADDARNPIIKKLEVPESPIYFLPFENELNNDSGRSRLFSSYQNQLERFDELNEGDTLKNKFLPLLRANAFKEEFFDNIRKDSIDVYLLEGEVYEGYFNRPESRTVELFVCFDTIAIN